MGIFNSIKNQIGRDIGKSISNVILKDAHSTPIRSVKNSSNTTARKNLSDYDRKLNAIDLSQTSKTIIRKLGTVLVEFETDINSYFTDNFIDLKEETELAKRFYQLLAVFGKIEKQFRINGDDTNRLTDIYSEFCEKPLLRCIKQLEDQETDLLIRGKYEELHLEIKKILK